MPMFDFFIRERLNQYEEYRNLKINATAPITLVNNQALDKFKTLQHITGDMKSTPLRIGDMHLIFTILMEVGTLIGFLVRMVIPYMDLQQKHLKTQ